ncbi:MAG: thioredoxin-disulfide reductase, partial [Clostridia bacterium]|nr:thioredoxin-disulfide reductase [Clostridia bacterium]
AIVGAGPAGMTAALYGARAGKRVILFEGAVYGGQIVQSRLVENYPGAPDVDGYTLAEQMMSPLRRLEVEVVSASVNVIEKAPDGGFTVQTAKENVLARTVILATGVTHRKLGVPGEDALIGRGISFCATCDGMFFRGREVAVIGGGNTAVQDALVLSEICSKVYLIHRRDAFRAEERLMERLRAAENVEIVTDTVVSEMRGENRLSGLVIRHVKTNEERELSVSGVFEAVGNLPQNASFADLVALDADGYILANERCETNVKGIFAAGDCRQKSVRQLTTATADGTVAALAAAEYC